MLRRKPAAKKQQEKKNRQHSASYPFGGHEPRWSRRSRRNLRLLRMRPLTPRDWFGRGTEWIARTLGTPMSLMLLTLFCASWIVWNTWGPEAARFDRADFGFTALTLILSLQASYAAPLILLAQNRQDDRERVNVEQDRSRAERTLNDTEYLSREVVALRLALEDMTQKHNQAMQHFENSLTQVIGYLEVISRQDAADPGAGGDVAENSSNVSPKMLKPGRPADRPEPAP